MAQEFWRRLRQSTSYVVDSGLTLLFPPTCPGCGRLGETFCAHCAQQVAPVPQPQCARCGLAQPVPTRCCAACARSGDTHLRFSRAAALHTSPLREAIHAFKYQAQPELAPLLARYLVAVFALPPWSTLSPAISAVVPVPLHAQRFAERGYNQAELLAQHFARGVGLDVQPAWLARTRETRQQVGLGPRDRRANVAGAFVATTDLRGQRLLLVDDVYTTGATLRACAAAARAGGAAAVYGLALAQPVRHTQPDRADAAQVGDDAGDSQWWQGEV